MSFAELKKKSSLESIVKKIEAKTGGYGEKDDRYWQPEQDKKTGLGSAVIRFLPTAEGADAPWVKTHKHSFKNEETGKWFVEECPSTIGEPCYVCTQLKPLWSGSEADKKVARDRKRNTSYIANVLVIKDPANPENEGAIKLFKFGKQIYDKIIAVVKPEFEDISPMNPTCFWEGADFRIRITKNEGGYRSYEKSSFDTPSPLFGGDDDKLEELWKKQYNLNEFLDPKNFKSAEDIKTKYDNFVNGTQQGASSAANRVLEELESKVAEAPKFKSEAPKVDSKSDDLDDDSWEDLLNDI